MNILPLLLIGLLLGGEKFSSFKDLLTRIDFASFSPVFNLLGVDKKTVDFLCSDDFANALSGGDGIKSLLPLLSSLLAKPQPENKDSKEQLKPCDYLSPIKNVAPTDVGTTIENYLG
ncbi:MAG: hypothetical protein IKA61_05120 [Clostridia bacterium]|nr:hypothetical protein [Clostridia bacterium]